MARLEDVALLNPPLGTHPADDAVVSFLPMSAVDADSVDAVNIETRVFSDVRKGYTPFVSDDVLVAKITPCFENGKIAQAKPTRDIGFASTEFHVIRPRSDELHPRFLVHFLRQDSIRKDGKRKMTGSAGQRRVPLHFLANLKIPIPSLVEQERVAAILDKADALRAMRRAAIAKLDTLTESIFLDMFGDPATNPKGWPIRPLKQCSAWIQIGPFGSLLHKEDHVEGGVPLINPKHIQEGGLCPDASETISTRKFAELATYHLAVGDVVMGRRGEMGRCAIVGVDSGPMLCGTGSLFVRPDNVTSTSLFLHFLLSSRAVKARLERLSLGQTLPNLNSKIVESLAVPIPPVTLQREFGARVAAARLLSGSNSESAAKLDALFASLQHRAFRGEL